MSCDGEPAPEREALATLGAEVIPPAMPNGDLMEVPEPVPEAPSAGGVLAVGEPELGWPE